MKSQQNPWDVPRQPNPLCLCQQLQSLVDTPSSVGLVERGGTAHMFAELTRGKLRRSCCRKAQRLFRQADRDHNHRLDREAGFGSIDPTAAQLLSSQEFFDYMHGLLNVIGIKQFKSVLGTELYS